MEVHLKLNPLTTPEEIDIVEASWKRDTGGRYPDGTRAIILRPCDFVGPDERRKITAHPDEDPVVETEKEWEEAVDIHEDSIKERYAMKSRSQIPVAAATPSKSDTNDDQTALSIAVIQ